MAAAIALTGGLAIQMASGKDPTLAPKAKQRTTGSQTAPAQVITRTS